MAESKKDTLKDEYLTHDYYEYEQGQAGIIVKDRLFKNIEFWKNIGASMFILFKS